VDILPYNESDAADGRLEMRDGIVFSMAGFRHVIGHAVHVEVDGGPTLPLAPLPLYALLKLVAFNDSSQAPMSAVISVNVRPRVRTASERFA
jgi:predicted nucleotidyltransferase